MPLFHGLLQHDHGACVSKVFPLAQQLYEGVDVKDPVQRAASVESVSPSEFKAVAAAKGTEGSKGGDR